MDAEVDEVGIDENSVGRTKCRVVFEEHVTWFLFCGGDFNIIGVLKLLDWFDDLKMLFLKTRVLGIDFSLDLCKFFDLLLFSHKLNIIQ